MQLIPYFQPIVDIATARVVGHEALARTIAADGKVMSAGHLFCNPAFDELEILDYDRKVRMLALQRFADAGQPGFLTINISPRWIDLLDDFTIPTIDMLDRFGIAPEKVVVEIVETDADPQKLSSIVQRYKKRGIRIAVDDFGAGYSQFDRVIRLEPDIVKLDMRLFKQAMHGGFPKHIVHALSYLADRMGSRVLCEGVETYEELRFALEIGSKLIQGYFFSPAQSTFTEAPCFERTISIQRRRFLFEGIRKEEQHRDDVSTVHHIVELLSRQVSLYGEVVDFSLLKNADDKNHIVSMFVCDRGGTQTSPTYRLNPAGLWETFEESIGDNWCWRPYFYQLLSFGESAQRKSVTSRPYHDALTGALVKTIARFVDDNKVLLVDIKHQGIFVD